MPVLHAVLDNHVFLALILVVFAALKDEVIYWNLIILRALRAENSAAINFASFSTNHSLGVNFNFHFLSPVILLAIYSLNQKTFSNSNFLVRYELVVSL